MRKLRRQIKQQTALEFLNVYVWALLIIGLMLSIVFVLTLSKPSTFYFASSCTIQPLLPCSQAVLSYNAFTPMVFYIQFTNNLGTPIYFPFNGVNVITTGIGTTGISSYTGNCTPSFATVGSQVLCITKIAGNVRPAVGAQTSTQFIINYSICSTNSKSSCLTTTNQNVYRVTGYSVQTVSPANVVLYNVTFRSNVGSGIILLNGVAYIDGSMTYFIGGNYALFGQAPVNSSFIGWSINTPPTGTPSMLSNTITQNTTLTLTSNALITVAFTAPPIPYVFCVGSEDLYEINPAANDVQFAPVYPGNGFGTFQVTNKYPVQFEDGSCAIYNNYIYCIGGETDAQVGTNLVYYAPISVNGVGAWTNTANYPLPIPFVEDMSCSTYKSYIYCVGGEVGDPIIDKNSNAVYYARLAPFGGITGSWVATSNYPDLGGAGDSSCFINKGYMYCVGNGETGHNTVYYAPVLNPGIGIWSASANSYPINFDNVGCSVYNNYVYCGGSLIVAPHNQFYYAPISSSGVGTWTATTSYPVGLVHAGCVTYKGYIYCAGSSFASGSDTYYAAISSGGIGTWTNSNNLAFPLDHASCQIPGSGGALYGGGGGAN